MNPIILATSAALVSALASSALAAEVGVSLNVGQPGFYGRVDIGDAPRPVVVYRQPVVIERAPVRVVQEPVYLHVPPGHAKHWSRHCASYRACGQPVYFVQENWYRDVYAPAHGAQRGDFRAEREHERDADRFHNGDRDEGHGHGRHNGKYKD